MRVVHCSTYLAQQETSLREQAHHARRRPLLGPSSWLRRLFWQFSADARHQRRQRDYEARRLRSEAEAYRRGRLGEDFVAQVLARKLDDRYVLFRNLIPPSPWQSGGDVDAVLVGPHGVTVLEVKTWSGQYRYSSDTWQIRSRRDGWQPTQDNPTLQARQNAQRLRAVLVSNGLADTPVHPIVVMASAQTQLHLHPPVGVYVYFACRPHTRLDWLEGRPASPVDAERIVAVLAEVASGHVVRPLHS